LFTHSPAPTQALKVGVSTKAPKANWAVLVQANSLSSDADEHIDNFVRLQDNAVQDKSGRTAEIHGCVRVDNPLAQLANRLRTLVAVSTMAIMFEKTIFFGFSGTEITLHFIFNWQILFFYLASDYRSLLLQLRGYY
jgi:hypothetical protein